MKHFFLITIVLVGLIFSSCKTTRQINKAIAPKDTSNVLNHGSVEDSIRRMQATINTFKSHNIDFKTFSAKIKVEIVDNNGKQPDITAVVRVIKDSAIWISLTATI